MDERLRFVARLLEGEKIAELCREFYIYRKTGYRSNRFKDCRLEGLTIDLADLIDKLTALPRMDPSITDLAVHSLSEPRVAPPGHDSVIGRSARRDALVRAIPEAGSDRQGSSRRANFTP